MVEGTGGGVGDRGRGRGWGGGFGRDVRLLACSWFASQQGDKVALFGNFWADLTLLQRSQWCTSLALEWGSQFVEMLGFVLSVASVTGLHHSIGW